MYTPTPFRVTDDVRLHELMRDHPFAALVSTDGDELQITHLPFVIDPERAEQGVLLAHMARANPHWRHFDGKREATVIFTGPHAYISPSWYADPHTVPTWNYAAVHVHGRPGIISDKSRARGVLERLVAEHEAPLNPPWTMDKTEPDVDRQLEYIVAFEMEITRLEGKFKFNQNRPHADRQGVIDTLAGNDDPLQRAVAQTMREQLEQND
jgi:transcriptional regulator